MRARLVALGIGLGVLWAPAVPAARTPALTGLCSVDHPQPSFGDGAAFHVLLTRLAGPAESVRTAQDQWLPGEQARVRQIGMAGSTLLRGSAAGLPGHEALEWQRTTCFVQGPGAAEALGRRTGADVVLWGEAACTAGDGHDLACARAGTPREVRASLTVLADLPQARPPQVGWRPASLPHPVNWGLPVQNLHDGESLLFLVQGLERLQQGAPETAAHLFRQAGARAAGLQVEALLLAGDLQGAREAAETELTRAEAVGGVRLARALVSVAGVHWFREQQPLARGALALAVSVASAVGERDVAAYATLQLALLDEQIGNQAGAEQAYDSLVDHAFLSHDLALRAQVHAGLGRTRQALGRTDDAHRAWLLALPAFEDGADPWALAVVLDGLVATGGRFERARRAAWLTQAQGLWQDLGQTERALAESRALVTLAAESETPMREPRTAWETRLQHALALGLRLGLGFEATGDREALGALHRDLARIAMHLGDVVTARAWLDVAGAAPGEQAEIEAGLAEILRREHDGHGALLLYQDALAHAEQDGGLREQARIAARIADLQRKVLRDVGEARRWSERALTLHAAALAGDAPPADAAEWARVGDVAMFAQQSPVAQAAYEQAEAQDVASAGRPDPQLPCKVGYALYAQDRFDEAVLAYERGVRVAAARGSEGLVRSCEAGALRAREAARDID